MKKIKVYPFLFIFVLLLSFFYVPLPSVKSANNWDNFIDFVRTNLGFVSVNNGSLSGMSRDDFYDSLYNTPLVWTNNGQDFSFTPANEFSRGEWTNVCKVGSSDDTRFNNFNIQDCLIKSDYIKDNGSGYDLSSFPSFSGSVNSAKPLDGVEVITNFSNFTYGNNSILYTQTCNILKNDISNNDKFFIVSYPVVLDNSAQKYVYRSVFYGLNNIDYLFFVKWKSGSKYQGLLKYHNNVSNSFIAANGFTYYCQPQTYNSTDCTLGIYNPKSTMDDCIVRGDLSQFTDSNIYKNEAPLFNLLAFTDNFYYFSNIPVVVSSTTQAAQNYYYWLKGAPSGGIYTTANATDTIYNYEYVNNNNWETAYNNYITDVSNYYSTTENITNENLTQYIDNSTTITNITNNYITNNGGESGEDDVITNSWLERIYNKILEIISILKGESVSESGDTYITDNSVKNEIVEYPSSNLFPDVPLDNFIDSSEDFTIDLFSSKLSAVISEAIPFCYIGILGRVSETLSANPSAPYWEIPFVIERLNIHESLVLDLTSSDWDNVHNVWIACFLILFVSFLFYLTYRIVLLVSSLFA